MKRGFIIFLFTIAAIAGNAQQLNTGKLSISTTGNNKLYVLAGTAKNFIENRDLIFRQVTPGNYDVKIYRLIRNDLATDNWNNYNTVFQKTVTIKAGYHTEITVNRFGQAYINEIQVTSYDNTDEWNSTILVNDDQWLSSSNTSAAPGGNSFVMSDQDFAEFKRLMRAETFENRMIGFFKNNINKNLLSARQVKELCLLMSFDNYKLDLAKYAYDYTADKGNYFVIYAVFTFDSYKKELENYIKNR